MIRINGEKLPKKIFPDGTPCMMDMPKYDESAGAVLIEWLYDAGEEFALYAACRHYARQGAHIELHIPYYPNARMDRTKKTTEVNTLLAFTELLGSVPDIDAVQVWDPHSDATVEALRGFVTDDVDLATGYRTLFASIWGVLRENRIDCVVFPDAGAKKKYSGLFPRYQRTTSAHHYLSDYPQLYGEKVRDWETGDILGLRVLDGDGEEVTGEGIARRGISSALIVDDICAYGGTIYHCANKLRKLGVEKVYAHISHTEDSIFAGHLLRSAESPIDGYVTTDDILHLEKRDEKEYDVPLKVSVAMRDEKNRTESLRF